MVTYLLCGNHVAILCIHPLTARTIITPFSYGVWFYFSLNIVFRGLRLCDFHNYTSDILLDFGLWIFLTICRFYPGEMQVTRHNIYEGYW